MHTPRQNKKKRGIIEAGAVLGAMLVFINVNAAPLSARSTSIQTGTLQVEETMVDAQVQSMKMNSVTNFEYKQTMAELDQKIAAEKKEIILNGAAAEAIQLCEKLYTASDFEALKLPKVSVLAGAELYLEANVDSMQIHTFGENDSVTVLYQCEDSNFYYVEYNELYRGYVQVNNLDVSILSKEQIDQVSEINRCRFAGVASGDAYIYAGPSEYAEIRAIAENETIMSIIGVQDGWFKVSVADSIGYVKAEAVTVVRMLTGEVDGEGYIKSARAEFELQKQLEAEQREQEAAAERERAEAAESYVTEGSYEEEATGSNESSSVSTGATASGSSVGAAIANTALSYLGVPYVYGGSSPSGFDCSGLVYYSAMLNGVALPRCADEQYYGGGTHVSFSDLAVGDLVFFSADWSNEIEHVGIYVGGGQFVHAPHTGDVVKISSITDYYARNYWGALRLG